MSVKAYVIGVDSPVRQANVTQLQQLIPNLTVFNAIDTRTKEKFNQALKQYGSLGLISSRLLTKYRTDRVYSKELGKLGCHFSHALLWRQLLQIDGKDKKDSEMDSASSIPRDCQLECNQNQNTDSGSTTTHVEHDIFYWIMEDDLKPRETLNKEIEEILGQLTSEEREKPVFIRCYSHPNRDREQFKKANQRGFFYRDATTGFVSYLVNYQGLSLLYRDIGKLQNNIDTIFSKGLTRLTVPPKYLHDTVSKGSRSKVEIPSTISR